MLRPVGGKDLERFSTQQEIKRLTHLLSHDIAKKLIKVWNGPTAQRKVPAGVFGGSAWALHDAIQGNKRQDIDFSHGNDSTRSNPPSNNAAHILRSHNERGANCHLLHRTFEGADHKILQATRLLLAEFNL